MGSPLGKYSDVAATIVGVGTVVTWLVVHAVLIIAQLVGGPAVAPGATEQLDLAGVAALGLILGQRSTTNGASAIAAATNLRLDALGAPSAEAARQVILPTPPAPPVIGAH